MNLELPSFQEKLKLFNEVLTGWYISFSLRSTLTLSCQLYIPMMQFWSLVIIEGWLFIRGYICSCVEKLWHTPHWHWHKLNISHVGVDCKRCWCPVVESSLYNMKVVGYALALDIYIYFCNWLKKYQVLLSRTEYFTGPTFCISVLV